MIAKDISAIHPPFPRDVPVAPISRISLCKILHNDPSEAARVLESCKSAGFFYLDLTDSDLGQQLIEDSETLLEFSQDFFAKDLKYKMRYPFMPGISLMGYKAAGTRKLTDKDSRRDVTEIFNVSKDYIYNIGPRREYPEEVDQNGSLFASFTKNSHATGMVLLRVLAQQLGLQDVEAFAKRSRLDQISGDHTRMTHTPLNYGQDSIGLISHTDFGSITILFNWLGGLQIQSREPHRAGEWDYVKPLPGHAIINLGDAMVTFSNGLLKSAKHRVVLAPGEQKMFDRYSVVYFVRPNDDVLMEALPEFEHVNEDLNVTGKFQPKTEEGKPLTVLEWSNQRTLQLTGGSAQKSN